MSILDRYGFPFPEGTSQYHIELAAYSFTRATFFPDSEFYLELGFNPFDFKFKDPYYHLTQAMLLDWEPGLFDLDVRGYSNTVVKRVIKAWCENEDIGAAGAASLSKTYGFSGCIVQDWKAAAHCTLVLVGSTSVSASEDRIWGQIRKLYNNGRYPVGKLIDYKNIITYDNFTDDGKDREYNNSIKAIALPSGSEGAKVVASTRGRKNKRVVAILDEMPEMDLNVADIRSNLSANEHFTFVGIGNPTPGMNPHTELCQPDDPKGYDSVNENMESWKTRTGICIFLNGDDSPNFAAPPNEPPPFPYLLTRKKQERMLKIAYGNTRSIEYVRNAKGFTFTSGSADCTVLSKEAIRAADILEEPRWDSRGKVAIASLDPAFTSGGDGCIATFGYMGWQYGSGKNAAYMSHQKAYFANVGEVYEDSIANQVVDDLIKFKVHPRNFGLDISQDGGKMLSAIIRIWTERGNKEAVYIYPISSQGAPSEKSVSKEDKRLCCDAYDRRVTEYWFAAAIGIRTRCLYGLQEDSDAASDLCRRMYLPAGKKVAVEIKKDMKKRTKKSPDNGDSFTYWVVMVLKAGLVFMLDIEKPRLPGYRNDKRGPSKYQPIGSYSSDDTGE